VTGPVRICFWSSGFTADSQALAHHLARQDDVRLTVALERPERYLAEPVNRFLPIPARFADRGERGLARALRREGFDLLIVDNHLPDDAVAPRILVLWHGLGWRVDDVTGMKKELRKLVGDVTRPNPRFRWQAFGDWDREYRIGHSGLAAENVVALGSAYSDLLLPSEEGGRSGLPAPEELRRAVSGDYGLDLTRPTILLGLTWHHGAVLAQWGEDAGLFTRLFDHAASRDANVLLRLHDRHRFTPEYLAMLDRVVAGRPGVRVTFKDEHPDSLVDLLVSDVLVSNYSSLLNPFYCTRKPSVHLDPHRPGQAGYVYRRWKGGRLREERVEDPAQVWKLDPADIGGLRARSFEEALGSIDRALAEPDCCRELARGFTGRHLTAPDGRTCERIAGFVRRWLAED
jgi:hypothetical protein